MTQRYRVLTAGLITERSVHPRTPWHKVQSADCLTKCWKNSTVQDTVKPQHTTVSLNLSKVKSSDKTKGSNKRNKTAKTVLRVRILSIITDLWNQLLNHHRQSVFQLKILDFLSPSWAWKYYVWWWFVFFALVLLFFFGLFFFLHLTTRICLTVKCGRCCQCNFLKYIALYCAIILI